MIHGKKVIAIIPARGGSKGLPRKNILKVEGKPLLAWTITEALQSKYIDKIILSSEDQEIQKIAKEWGCEVPFSRPEELATDEANTEDVIIHAMQHLKEVFEYIVLLQPTSPLRLSQDIDTCIAICEENDAPSCVTVSESETSPYLMYFLDTDKQMKPVIDINNRPSRRQDFIPAYELNGSVYVTRWQSFKKAKHFVTEDTLAHTIPKERALDIDTEEDLTLFKYLAAKSRNS